MVVEHELDLEIVWIKKKLKDVEASKKLDRKFIVVNNLLYFISDPGNEPVLRLFVPNQFRRAIVNQYHDEHMVMCKSYSSIMINYLHILRQEFHMPV